ncbi:hypothetical protein TRFO_04249 [Tritrichomonas foetus]|uniref:VPS9 domain-containing protein n=1 Tax=Tritrichomonas foetus TaxID=1144522 RepID=A0A1J4KLJ2_9EUKA|nr:hypothetical protein TRFO_04249 [Tritrichomonas foetus]|eukprot:OHT10245.1 hypothetical protein TRFO_04249 [Tritrichomonas foetus]
MEENILSLAEYHAECREIDTTCKFQLNEIASSRQGLLEKAKETQEKRCLTSLRSGYCLRMTTQNVKDFSQLPFIKPDGLQVSDQLMTLTSLANLRNDINAFIHSLYNSMSDLPTFFSSVTSEALLDNVPFLPANVKPRDFLACSTLPALFGHCWSFELRHAYINFLMDIVKQLPNSVFTNFREHWLFECFKNYIHASNIHHFLKLSISDTMLQLVRENTNRTPRLTSYASDMITRMRDNISTFPKDVRLLLKKFADLAPDESQRMSRIEILFIDCILAPAISTPKAYCVLPPSFTLDMSLTGPARTLQLLAQHFRLILHPQQAQLRNIPQKDIEDLQKIPLGSFLMQLTDVNEETLDIGGPRITKIMSLLNTDSIFLMFTMSDICLLAKILNSEKLVSKEKIPIDQPVNFEFFRIEFNKVDVFGFSPPEILTNEVEAASDSKNSLSVTLSHTASAFFKFMTCAHEQANLPPDLNKFLHFYEQEARLKQDFITYTYINHLILKLSELNESQHCDILFALGDEIRRHREYLDRNNALLTNIARMMQKLDTEMKEYNEKADQSYPIIYSSLLNLFLQQSNQVESKAHEMKEIMLNNKKVFQDFFAESIVKIRDFIVPIADYALNGVASHFHTWLMQMMTLRDFIDYHPEFTEGDMRLTIVTKDVIQHVCVKPAPPKLANIFANPPLFDFAIMELRASEFTEIPLESMTYISSAINLIQRMFDLSIGGSPQADEMTPLFNYTLLSSGFNTMLSFEKYLEHFLFELPQTEVKFINEQTTVALTHFINHVSSLDQIVLTQLH